MGRWFQCSRAGLFAFVVVMAATSARAAQRFVVAPTAPWVDVIAVDYGWTAPPEHTADGLTRLLIDRQWRVDGALSDDHLRSVRKITSPEGLAAVSQLTLQWDPSYQTLTIHAVAVHREGKRLNRLHPDRIDVLRRETDLENQIYDGALSAVIVLEDLRVGDVLDFAYTIRGTNPVMRGKQSRWFTASFSNPVHHVRSRVLWPADRPVQIRASANAPPVREQQLGSFIERVWEQRNVAAVVSEDRQPSHFDPFARIQFSEDKDWADVVRWAVPLHHLPAKPGPALARRLDRLRAAATTDEEKIAAVLRFTQEEIRYVGIELGEGSHRPSPPDVVFDRRFGDCKDKAMLAVAMLRWLDVDAWPALVNTWERSALDQQLPTRTAFNHVILAAQLGDQLLWLDPTNSTQAGLPSRLTPPPYRRALLVREGTDALTEIALPLLGAPLISTEERWVLAGDRRSATVDIVTVQRGFEADDGRRQLATKTRAEVSKSWLNYYAVLHPSIRERAAFDVVDDVEGNVLTVTEHYEVPEAWIANDDGIQETVAFRATSVADRLRFPTVRQRQAPLSLAFPVHVEHRIVVALPGGFTITPSTAEVSRPELLFRSAVEVKPDRVELSYRYSTTTDEVPAAATAAHLEALKQIDTASDYSLIRTRAGAPAADPSMNWPIAVLATVLFALLVVVAARWYRAPRPAPAPRVLDPAAPVVAPGFRGWLLLLGLIVLSSPLRLAYAIWGFAPAYALENWTKLTAPTGADYTPGAALVLIGGLAGNLALFVGSTLLAAVMLARRQDFVRVFIAFTVFHTIVIAADTLCILVFGPIEPTDMREFVRVVAGSLLWSAYVLKSARVKATFTR